MQVAIIREHWPKALAVLEGIPAVVAEKSLPVKDLHEKAWQAETDSRDAWSATYHIVALTLHEVAGLAPESRKVLVDEFKVGWSDPGELTKP